MLHHTGTHLEFPPVQALPVDAVCPQQQVHQQALVCRGGQLTTVQQLYELL
jgi:hypothetical protein